MPCHVKICGISNEPTLHAAVNGGAHYIGFVHFPKSPRHVTLERAAELKALLPVNVSSVLVVVNPDDALLANISKTLAPDYLQLHGDESPERVSGIKKAYPSQKLIKAISVSGPQDLLKAASYEPYVDMLMFDAKAPAGSELPGGNGISFDWKILHGFKSLVPWMLSGGLTPENVAVAIQQSGAKIVDVSSGVESAPGKKDAARIQAFISSVN